jgi:hypothetical protein
VVRTAKTLGLQQSMRPRSPPAEWPKVKKKRSRLVVTGSWHLKFVLAPLGSSGYIGRSRGEFEGTPIELDSAVTPSYPLGMDDIFEDFFRSFTEEVKATIRRIDTLIGPAHWPSVGGYKEGVIRRQLADCVPQRYTVSTGFVLSRDGAGETIRSRQIDVLVWDSHNYSPIFRDGSFVVIPPQALRVAMEIKGNLKTKELRESLENLDSLSPFMNIITTHHSNDAEAKTGFRRYVVAAESPLEFPSGIFDRLYKYYIKCVYDPEEPTEKHVQLTTPERTNLTMGDLWWGITPWISGIAILDKGMVHANRLSNQMSYLVINDVVIDKVDHTMGLLRSNVERFLANSRIHSAYRDHFRRMPRGGTSLILPIPYNSFSGTYLSNQIYKPAEPHFWTLDDAKKEKADRDVRKAKHESTSEDAGD